jgi:hypothetical protein
MHYERSDFHDRADLIAQTELTASFFEDSNNVLANKLYDEFVASAGAQSLDDWLCIRLKDIFRCVDVRPEWRDGTVWPFLDGEPMVFIHQFDTPTKEVSKRYFATPSTFYVFGARVPGPDHDNWKMEYRVICQLNISEDGDPLYESLSEHERRVAMSFTGKVVPHEEQFPNLVKFIPRLFYPGYEADLNWEDFEGPAYALAAISFLAHSSHRVITNTYEELVGFISLSLPEAELKEVVTKSFGCKWDPASEDMTYEEFLDNVASIWEEWVEAAEGAEGFE